MKKIVLLGISLYQTFVSPFFKQVLGVYAMCRFKPTCSQYATMCITRYGLIKGGALAIKRFFACQPFTKTYGKHY